MSSMSFEVSLDKLKFVFPRSLLEICYIIQQDLLNSELHRERTDHLLSMDLNGQYTKPFQVHNYSDGRMCFQFTTTSSYFEEDFLCVHIESLQPTDHSLAQKLNDLPQPFTYPHSASFTNDLQESQFSSILHDNILTEGVPKDIGTIPRLSNLAAFAAGLPGPTAEVNTSTLKKEQSTQTESHKETIQATMEVDTSRPGITVIKRKRGRPKKVDKLQEEDTAPIGDSVDTTVTDEPAETNKEHEEPKPDVTSCIKKNEDSSVKVAPSGRIIRRPAWLKDVHDIDDALKITDPDILLDDESEQDSDPEYRSYLIQHNNTQSDTEDRQLPDNANSIERSKKRRDLAGDENNLKSQHRSKGQKRPTYKREANIECRFCHKLYKDKSSLIFHIKRFHNKHNRVVEYIKELKESNRIPCNVCGKLIINRSTDLNNHMMRVHGEDDNFISKCDECGLEFKRSFLLTEHKKRSHPKHDRVLCHLCPASFKIKAYLTEHLKYKHNETVRWKCDSCYKLFSSPKNLLRHQKLHQDAIYSCPECHKMFHNRNNMNRHVLYVHESHKLTKHICERCGKEFNTKKLLEQHMNSVHVKMSSFYCDICKKYFTWKEDLVNHATTYHPGTPILSTNNADLYNNNIRLQQSNQGYLVHNENQSNSTIIIQSGGNGSIQDQQSAGEIITQQVDMRGYDEAIYEGQREKREASNMIIDQGSGLPPSIDVNSIQQAIAAIEQANGSFSDGGEKYISVIDADGNEIMVEIVSSSHNQEMPFPGILTDDPSQSTASFTSNVVDVQPSNAQQSSSEHLTIQQTALDMQHNVADIQHKVTDVQHNATDIQHNVTNLQHNATELSQINTNLQQTSAGDPTSIEQFSETVKKPADVANSNFNGENQTIVSTGGDCSTPS